MKQNTMKQNTSINRHSAVPSSRVNRLFRLGKIATGMAGGAFNEGVRQLARGDVPKVSDLLLTPANARRITNQLAEMRGAAMKIGQLLSMEAGDLLPPELTDILSRLRDSAHAMPRKDVYKILEAAWGEKWREKFHSFNDDAFAAASIGQVHEAVDLAGRRLAVKIQYPGIARSIDSDVDNAISLLRLFRLIPESLDIEPLLEIAKQQLHDEANYELEAHYLNIYRERMNPNQVFQLPEVIDELSCRNILTMSFVEGEGIETLRQFHAETRDRVASELVHLALKEFLDWGMVQTDANFANFRFNSDTGLVGLLDFGALRIHEAGRSEAFSKLLSAAMEQDLVKIIDAACDVGYVSKEDPFNYRIAMADLILTAAEPALCEGAYNFGSSTLSQRVSEKLYRIRSEESFQRMPPADVIFLHRKLAGIYLLCANLRAKVDVKSAIQAVLSNGSQQQPALTDVSC